MNKNWWMAIAVTAASVLGWACYSPAAAGPRRTEPGPVAPKPVALQPEAPSPALPKLETSPVNVVAVASEQADSDFAAGAFPPTLSDRDWHRKAWARNDCLRCHETGVRDAPAVEHSDMPGILLTAKCRTCHVFISGSDPRVRPATRSEFADFAFPPMIPASTAHEDTWNSNNCRMCHLRGVLDAPIVKHEGLPALLLKSKCRTCHVQVRAANPVSLDRKE